jgi:hypothetical protein
MVGKVDQLTRSNHSFLDTELNTRELDDSLIEKVNLINASHSEAETSEELAIDPVDSLVDQKLTKVNQGNLTEEAICASSERAAPLTQQRNDFVPFLTEPNAPLETEVAQPQETAAALKVGNWVHWNNCPTYCEQFAPFEIISLDGDYAKLDLINKPVPLAQLRLAK